MKKLLIFFLLLLFLPSAVKGAGTEYSFVIAKLSPSMLFTLKYNGEYVTMSIDMLSMNEDPEVVRRARVGSLAETTEGGVAFFDTSDKAVAEVGCKPNGTGAYIIYLDRQGGYKRVMQTDSRHEKFLAELNRLKSTLSGHSQSSSAQKPSSEGRLPAKGDLTAYRLATHPIGFLPSDWRSETDIKQAMREEGWPEANGYRADLNFKVPFTLHGAEIWDCGWSFNRGRLTMYSMDTYPMSGTVTEKRILTYVNKLLDSLTTNGFELISHKVDNSGRGNMYYWDLSKGATTVRIIANSAGKVFFTVRVK